MRIFGKEQHGHFIFLQSLPKIVSIRFAHSAALPFWLWRDHRQIFGSARQNSPVSLLKICVRFLYSSLTCLHYNTAFFDLRRRLLFGCLWSLHAEWLRRPSSWILHAFYTSLCANSHQLWLFDIFPSKKPVKLFLAFFIKRVSSYSESKGLWDLRMDFRWFSETLYTMVRWERKQPSDSPDAYPGVYCLRTSRDDLNESTPWPTIPCLLTWRQSFAAWNPSWDYARYSTK